MAALAIGCFSIYSCNKVSESEVDRTEYSKFLDFDPASREDLTDDRIEILNEAFLRISKVVVYDGAKLNVTRSATELNMSDRLFRYVANGLSGDNMRAIPLTKSDAEVEHEWGINYSTTRIRLDLRETVDFMETMRRIENVESLRNALVAGSLPVSVAKYTGLILSGFEYYKGICTQSETQKFIRSGANESVLTIHTQMLNGMNLSSTSYLFNY